MAVDDSVDISCQYQRDTVSGLMCRAANTKGRGTTSDTTPEVCSECDIGRVQRDLGCMNVGGELLLARTFDGIGSTSPDLWCRLRKRETTFDSCRTCSCIESSTASLIVTTGLDIMDEAGFTNAKQALIEARTTLQQMDYDACIRWSAVAIESVCKSILDQRGKPYPQKEQLTDLFKAVRDELGMAATEGDILMVQVVGSITGSVQQLAGVRNNLGDAHGRGLMTPELYFSYAELALNLSATLVTYLVRRKMEVEQK